MKKKAKFGYVKDEYFQKQSYTYLCFLLFYKYCNKIEHPCVLLFQVLA